MPPEESIWRPLLDPKVHQYIVNQGMTFSPFVRIVFLALLALFVWKKKILPAYLAAYVGLACIAAAIMAIAFQYHTVIPTFFVLFPVGLMWGRESLVMPPVTPVSKVRLSVAGALAVFAFFYPGFLSSWKIAAFAPLGLLAAPTLVLASAAIIATGRAFSLYVAIPTWAATVCYGVIGVRYLDVKVDWALFAAAALSIASYLISGPAAVTHKGHKFKKKH